MVFLRFLAIVLLTTTGLLKLEALLQHPESIPSGPDPVFPIVRHDHLLLLAAAAELGLAGIFALGVWRSLAFAALTTMSVAFAAYGWVLAKAGYQASCGCVGVVFSDSPNQSLVRHTILASMLFCGWAGFLRTLKPSPR
ncbi:MAG: hypothetical protein D6766_02005 [Verrucomicrobia bacterium]|nr:MAG: hypothetical protein D6766_02005 [Verrucomicrobiota bacterium]